MAAPKKGRGKGVDPLAPPIIADPPAGRLLGLASKKALVGALLLVGEDGIGKKRFALEMARRLNCTGDPPTGLCNSCRRTLERTHPDLTILAAPKDKKEILVDAAREVVNESAKRPYEGEFRVVIVDEADRLNVSSGNALLKVLEEPPSFLVFLLVTSRPEQVLPTIRSRATRHHIPTLPAAKVRELLAARGWDEEEIARGLPYAGGRIGFLLGGGWKRLEPWRERWLAAFEGAADKGSAALFPLATDLADEDDVVEVARLGAALLRDLRVVSGDPEGESLRHHDLYGRLADLSPRLAPRFVDALALKLARLPDRLSTNPNLKLLFEETFLRLGRGAAEKG